MPELRNIYYNKTKLLILVFLLLSAYFSKAQNAPLKVHLKYAEQSFSLKKIKHKKSANDSIATKKIAIDILKQYKAKGYLACSIDSIKITDNTATLFISTGQFYTFGLISLDSTFKNIEQTKKPKRNSVASYYKLLNFESILLSKYKNTGYPLTVLKKESSFTKHQINIDYSISKGPIFTIDSVGFFINKLTSQKHLYQLSNIKPGDIYNESKISTIESLINNSGYMQTDSVKIKLNENNTAYIKVATRKTKGNSFSGFIGIAPNPNKETQVTGNINLTLLNAFKKGEYLNFEWNKSGELSQQLKGGCIFPYAFGTPIGFLADIDIDKQDSTYNAIYYRGGLSFSLSQYGFISGYLAKKQSYGLGDFIEDFPEVNSLLYGIDYKINQLNRTNNPTKGFVAKINISAGNRIETLSDKLEYKSLIIKSITDIKAIIPVPLGAFMVRNQSIITQNDSIKINELNRLGGINTIRGFNERAIFSKNSSITTLEYRLIFEQQSYIAAFYDFAWLLEPSNDAFATQFKQSIGASINVSTKAGELSLIYAVGKSQDNPFQVNKGLIHIGYINNF